LEHFPVDGFSGFGLHRISRVTIGKYGQISSSGEAADSLRVIAVFVGKKDCIDRVKRLANCFEQASDSFSRKAYID
jgi:hypothetical protein